MARRPQKREGLSLAHDDLNTRSDTARPRGDASSRRSRESRRAAFSLFALIGTSLAVFFAGGAMFSGANASTRNVNDPLANTVRAIGGAPALGPVTGMKLNADLVDIAATPSGRGYWTVASDGGVFTFGDATFFGSVGNLPLVEPVVGMDGTKSGKGDWLVASDGGVFSFGDAQFHGSIAGSPSTSEDIVDIASTPSGRGYWLVGSRGGVWAWRPSLWAGGVRRGCLPRGRRLVGRGGDVGPAPADGRHRADAVGSG